MGWEEHHGKWDRSLFGCCGLGPGPGILQVRWWEWLFDDQWKVGVDWGEHGLPACKEETLQKSLTHICWCK